MEETSASSRVDSPLARRRLYIFLFTCIFLCISQENSVRAEISCQIAQEVLRQVSAIRGLTKKRSVPCEIRNQEEIRSFIVEALKTKVSAQKLSIEERVFRALGVFPDDFDYQRGIVDLYVSQIGGYYDPDKKEYVMASWMPELTQPVIAAHELTHALQDQYYQLGRLIDQNFATTDELLARQALIEGDATAVMMDYSLKPQGKRIQSQESVDGILLQNVLSMGMMSGLTKTPEVLKMQLLFPYTSGLRFVHALLRKGGYRQVDQAFQNLPRSTHEILHPEVYPDTRGFDISKTLLDAKLGTPLWSDTLGEFLLTAILGLGGKEKEDAVRTANAWSGDAIGFYGKPSEKAGDIWWNLSFSSEAAARAFVRQYGLFLERHFSLTVGMLVQGKEVSQGNRTFQLSQREDRVQYHVREK